MKFNNINIGDIVKDKQNRDCKVINKTTNSIEIFMKKTNKKGIDCTQWFTDRNFEKLFK